MNYIRNKGKTCHSVDCDNSAEVKGYCMRHYGVLKRTGNPNSPIRGTRNLNPYHNILCLEEYCDKLSEVKGRCKRHYRSDYFQKNKKEEIVVCRLVTCSNEFIKRSCRRFCSEECLKESKRKMVRQGQCFLCETTFETIVDHQVFCSPKCRIKEGHKRKTERTREEYAKTCLYASCQQFFQTASKSKKYCSPLCATKNSPSYQKIRADQEEKRIKKENSDSYGVVYRFVDKKTGRVRYIGSTIQDPKKRRWDHRKELRDNCDFEVICSTKKEFLRTVEASFIKEALEQGEPLENKIQYYLETKEIKTQRDTERVCRVCNSLFLDTAVGNQAEFCSPLCKKKGTKKLITSSAGLNNWDEHNKIQVIEFIKNNVLLDENECWLWQRSISDKGYGNASNSKLGFNVKGHQLSYRVFKGLILGQINHSCHKESCCNPDHLYDGTQAENLRDQFIRGTREVDMSGI